MSDLYSIIRGFSFNNIHNHNMDVVMHSKSIQPPAKKKIKESVPFMNGSYDFSTVATNGDITYESRDITIVLGLPSISKEDLQVLYSKTLEWLYDGGKAKLIFDDIIDFYFMAEVESSSSFEETLEFGRLTVKFVADPFKKSIYYVGSEEWDGFNFELDYIQDVEFDVTTTLNITIYNGGRVVCPVVNCSANMQVILNGYTANFITGDNQDWKFRLQNGTNNITINGTGHIKFIFRKEIL